MARLEVIVDGVTKYEGEVPDSYLPKYPSAFPQALGAAGPIQPAHPVMRGALIGALGPAVAGFIEQIPELQPITADLQMSPDPGGGFAILVTGPTTVADDWSHLTVKIDGTTKFDGDVPTAYLPERAQDYPIALRAPNTHQPGQAVPPLARVYILGIIGPEMVRQFQGLQLIQPIDAKCEMNAASGGFVITVSGPAINVDELKP
jgi:hypothetical protein